MRGAVATALLAAVIASAPGARAERATVVAAGVEAAANAEVIRLVVSPSPKSFDPEIVCGGDSIRIRIDSVAARGEDVEEIDVPTGGPMRRVRIAPRTGGGAVVQIYTVGSPYPACERTTAIQLGGEVVVSMALTAEDQKRLAQRRAEVERASALAAETIRAVEALRAADEKAPVIDEKAPAAEEALVTETAVAKIEPARREPPAPKAPEVKRPADPKAPAGAAALGLGLKDKARPLPVTSGDGGPSGVRYALGFLFAAGIGALAWWTKRRKRRKADALTDDIDIVSSRRLSAHQQLIVAQVQGTKFLLAVSDKAVTNLGAVPEARAFAGRFAQADVAAQDGVLTPPRSSLELSREEVRPSDRGFDRELESALDRGAPASAPAPSYSGSAEAQSNVAGLISMARMRATMRDSRRGPVAEA
jgi:flagellar biogenesis protein FliO